MGDSQVSHIPVRRAIVIVLDSVGAGELPDAARYGDSGSNTLSNLALAVGGLFLPNLGRMGLGNIVDIKGTPAEARPLAFFGKASERSAGKDTTTGHWEMMGLIIPNAFPTYPDGFPADVVSAFEEAIGRKTLGNVTASGTEIIAELGAEHVATGRPIIYTSADSVFQIAAHEDIIPIPELYRICQIARDQLRGEHAVGRVIARPFVGGAGAFVRTSRRHDYSLAPIGATLLDVLSENAVTVTGVGKINDIFTGRGISASHPTSGNAEGMSTILRLLGEVDSGLIYANLVDFDMLYGHRNDTQGYAGALAEVDAWLPELLSALRGDDLLVITADHGCDPTTASTDHSREHIPLLVYSKAFGESGGAAANRSLGTRGCFGDIAITIAELMGCGEAARAAELAGSSFAGELGPGKL